MKYLLDSELEHNMSNKMFAQSPNRQTPTIAVKDEEGEDERQRYLRDIEYIEQIKKKIMSHQEVKNLLTDLNL